MFFSHSILQAQSKSEGEFIPGYYVTVAAYAESQEFYAIRFTNHLLKKGHDAKYGFNHPKKLYFVYLNYFTTLREGINDMLATRNKGEFVDAWGGPDKSHESFTPLQQAMAYTMSSTLTTGGIRGGEKHPGAFQPRSFNMGISKTVYEKTRGFRFTRFAEDIEISIRMEKDGFKSVLIPEAFVYHKRRTSFKEFYKQVSNFGKGRVQVGRVHKHAIKVTHWLPTLFTLGLLTLPILIVFGVGLFITGVSAYLLYGIFIIIDSFRASNNLLVSLLSVPSAFVQLIGYGLGFLSEWNNKPR